jgi:hypothetical protein
MTYLATLTGSGEVLADGVTLGKVEYTIRVSRSRQLIDARGTITGADGLLFQLVGMGAVVLLLDNGKVVSIIVERYSPPSGIAPILVSGPVPGF